jgi:hypothetical protein
VICEGTSALPACQYITFTESSSSITYLPIGFSRYCFESLDIEWDHDLLSTRYVIT